MTLPSMVLVRTYLSRTNFADLMIAGIRLVQRDGRKQNDLIHDHGQDVPEEEHDDRTRDNSTGWKLVDSGTPRIHFNAPDEEKQVNTTCATTPALLPQDLCKSGYKLAGAYVLKRPGENQGHGILVLSYVLLDHEDPAIDLPTNQQEAIQKVLDTFYRSAYVYDNPDNTMSVDVAGVVHEKTLPSIHAVRERRRLRVRVGKSGGLNWSNEKSRAKVKPPLGVRTLTLWLPLFPGSSSEPSDFDTLSEQGVEILDDGQLPVKIDESQHYGHPNAADGERKWDGITLSPEDLIRDLGRHGYEVTNLGLLEGETGGHLVVTLSFHGDPLELNTALKANLETVVLKAMYLYTCITSTPDQVTVLYEGLLLNATVRESAKVLKHHHLRVDPNNGVLVKVPRIFNLQRLQPLVGAPCVRFYIRCWVDRTEVDPSEVFNLGTDSPGSHAVMAGGDHRGFTMVVFMDVPMRTLPLALIAEYVAQDAHRYDTMLELNLETLEVIRVNS